MTVWIYVNTSKQVGDPDHLKVFANEEAAQAWFEENDPEGVAFEYEVRSSLMTTRGSRPVSARGGTYSRGAEAETHDPGVSWLQGFTDARSRES